LRGNNVSTAIRNIEFILDHNCLGHIIHDFVGIYVPEATIHFPENIFKNASQQKIKVAGKNILIAGQYLIGTIKINAKAIEGEKYQIEQGIEKIIFDAATIEKELKLRGIEKLQTKYDAKNAQFIIYFYLTINS
jgi:hypothetical protein